MLWLNNNNYGHMRTVILAKLVSFHVESLDKLFDLAITSHLVLQRRGRFRGSLYQMSGR